MGVWGSRGGGRGLLSRFEAHKEDFFGFQRTFKWQFCWISAPTQQLCGSKPCYKPNRVNWWPSVRSSWIPCLVHWLDWLNVEQTLYNNWLSKYRALVKTLVNTAELLKRLESLTKYSFCIAIFHRLSGRLDLLINQIKQNTDEDLIEDSDLLVYEDKGKNIFIFVVVVVICIQICFKMRMKLDIFMLCPFHRDNPWSPWI